MKEGKKEEDFTSEGLLIGKVRGWGVGVDR